MPEENPQNRIEVFNKIHLANAWGGEHSTSGKGSDPRHTAVLVRELSALLCDLGISKMLDIPCGDFCWMQCVALDGIEYVGADIVGTLVQQARTEHGGRHRKFLQLDIVTDDLPKADLVLSRDCLVHLPNQTVLQALANICRSGSEYLLTTTFPGRARNAEISTGGWRPINLQAPPYGLPTPICLLNEQYRGDSGKFQDKSLALWRTADIAARPWFSGGH